MIIVKMKIGQLVKQSGVPSTTIHYYVKEGILNAPEKINKRISLYDEALIARLKMIQKLQEKRFPLTSIKKILARIDQGVPLEEAETLENIIFGLPISNADELIDQKVFMDRTGLTSEETEKLERSGLLIPFSRKKGRKLFDHDDVAMGKSVFKQLFQFQVPLQDMQFYLTLGRQITEKELQLRKKIIQGMTVKDNAKVTVDLTNGAILSRSYFLKRLFQAALQKKTER
ncbi:MAG TPA: MerR family transcriptional regulator [Smithellaceae bacterium]|nr:MerR family transcriptional regulator [Smithellaceae bacterium]